jgi:hypothetical protein
LTRDEILNGITAQQFTQSLPLERVGFLDSQPSIGNSSSRDVFEELNPNRTTIALPENAFDVHMAAASPSHNTIEVKQERLELAGECLPNIETPSSGIIPSNLKSSIASASLTPVASRHLPNNDFTNRPSSPAIVQKRMMFQVSVAVYFPNSALTDP